MSIQNTAHLENILKLTLIRKTVKNMHYIEWELGPKMVLGRYMDSHVKRNSLTGHSQI